MVVRSRPPGMGLLSAAVLALCLAGAAAAAPPKGHKPSFIDGRGRQAIFNVVFPEASMLAPGPIDAAEAASEFDRLCLKTRFDPAALAEAARASSLGLSPLPLRYLGDRNTPPFDLDGWHAPSAALRIWNGDPRAFRKLPFITVTGPLIISGPVKPMQPQCNLELASFELGDWNGLVSALAEAIGRPPSSERSGKKWGQAVWEGGSETIGLRVDGLNKPSQTVHIGIVKLSPAP